MEKTTMNLFGTASLFTVLNFLLSDIAIIFYICIITDFITGVINALVKKQFDYHQVLMGIYNKVLEIVIISFCVVAGDYMEIDISNAILLFYIVYELLSIVTNIKEYVHIPDKLLNILNNIKSDVDKKL